MGEAREWKGVRYLGIVIRNLVHSHVYMYKTLILYRSLMLHRYPHRIPHSPYLT